LKSSPFRLVVLALALTAGRGSADLGCVDDIRKAGPDGSFCHGSTGPHNHAAQQPALNPAAATQLTNMAGGVIGAALGSALVAPLPNQYQGHRPVKSVITDDDEILTPGTGAASDIIGDYNPEADDSYASRLGRFRELHDAEMDQRRAALEKLKGTPAEKWCAAHIGILFPEPPKLDIVNSYPNKVRAYDREKQIWDKRCGGPSQQVGYQGFTDELAALKPDAPPAPAAGATARAPTYEAPAPPAAAPNAEPEKTAADSFADAEKELEAPPAKKAAASTDASSSAQGPPADQSAAPDSDAGPSPDDSANMNHSTKVFGEKNAKVTAKDLTDTRAPELEDLRPGSSGAGAQDSAGTSKPSGSASGSPGKPSASPGASSVASATPGSASPVFALPAPGAKIPPPGGATPPAKKNRFRSPAKEILGVIKKSPTFYAIYQDLEKNKYHIIYVPDEGVKIRKDLKRIFVNEDLRGHEDDLATLLAHEFGHSTYKNNHPDIMGMTRDAYTDAFIKDLLADEGQATLVNIKIKKELKANKGPDIALPGAHGDEYLKIYDRYPDEKDHDKARDEIGASYSSGERPSADLNLGGVVYHAKDYHEYYTLQAHYFWDLAHPKSP
jgi:hypothetical protein